MGRGPGRWVPGASPDSVRSAPSPEVLPQDAVGPGSKETRPPVRLGSGGRPKGSPEAAGQRPEPLAGVGVRVRGPPHCIRSGCSCGGWYCTKAAAGAAADSA